MHVTSPKSFGTRFDPVLGTVRMAAVCPDFDPSAANLVSLDAEDDGSCVRSQPCCEEQSTPSVHSFQLQQSYQPKMQCLVIFIVVLIFGVGASEGKCPMVMGKVPFDVEKVGGLIFFLVGWKHFADKLVLMMYLL